METVHLHYFSKHKTYIRVHKFFSSFEEKALTGPEAGSINAATISGGRSSVG